MGTYKGGSPTFRSVSENLESMKSKYMYKNGLFGVRGQGKSNNIRNIVSSDPEKTAKAFYDNFGYGGIEEPLYYKDGSFKGYEVRMADGTIINWRQKSGSKDKSPAVDISVELSNDHGNLRTQKIHFVKE